MDADLTPDEAQLLAEAQGEDLEQRLAEVARVDAVAQALHEHLAVYVADGPLLDAALAAVEALDVHDAAVRGGTGQEPDPARAAALEQAVQRVRMILARAGHRTGGSDIVPVRGVDAELLADAVDRDLLPPF